MKEGLLTTLSILLPFTIVLWLITTRTHLQECVSESLQGVRYILVMNGLPLKRGDIVSIQGHTPSYVKGKYFAKRLVGLSGDVIVHNKKGIRLFPPQALPKRSPFKAPLIPILPLLETTTEGRPLTPISPMRIPPGYVFVAGDHPRSFDSRYKEFGLVPIEKVWGKAVWQW